MAKATSHFEIPDEFKSELRLSNLTDARSDAEILDSVDQYIPVSSEKNVWAFWDKGPEKMPGWNQRNVCGWVRTCGSGEKPWTVRVLDADPQSPNYALKFVPKEYLPNSFVDGDMVGPYIGPHSADFLRGALLYLYGGVFIDVGCILTRHLDRIGWNELEDPDSPYRISVPIMYGQTIGNHFVMARKGDPFIKRWHDLFVHFWQGRKDCKGISQDPLLAFLAEMDYSESQENDFNWNWKVPFVEVFEYISQVMAWIRVARLEEAGENFDGSEYWQKHVFGFDIKEDWPAEQVVGFDGEKIYAALSTKLDADSESEEHKLGYKLVWTMLARSCMQKVTHGKQLTHDVHLGVLWDENEGKDIERGTFAELLRYGTTHFEQTRECIKMKECKKGKSTMKKKLLEP